MYRTNLILSLLLVSFSFTPLVMAGPPKHLMKDPKFVENYMDKKLDHSTGFEGRRDELGQEVAKVIKTMHPDVKPFDEQALGHYTDMAIKTMNHSKAYQHEFNDALVKMHLTALSFAKKHNMVKDLVQTDLETTEFMLKRVAGAIKTTGRKDYALKAIIEQTTCFYQLVEDWRWQGNDTVVYTSPYGHVLAASQKVGIFENLTEEEIHNTYTIPRYQAYAEVLGVKFDVSPLGKNGEITIRVAD